MNVARFADQGSRFCFRQPVLGKVAADAAAKILRLANVQYGAVSIFVKVNAGRGGKLRDSVTKIHWQLIL